MVRSKLDQNITYDESKTIDKEDYDYDAPQFDIELFPNNEATIALGRVKYIYVDKNVLFVPVYLVSDDKILEKIGIYEFLANKYTQIVDEDGDIDITLMDEPLPLYYRFFTEKYLKNLIGVDSDSIKSETPKIIISDVDKSKRTPVISIMDEEVKSDEWSSPNDTTVLEEILSKGDVSNKEMREKEQYKPLESDTWIQKYMKNSNYSLLDNEGGGDCLFAVIRDAYKGMGKETSVEELRKIVSDAAGEKVFSDFKEHYDMYNNEIEKLTTEQIKIRDELKVLKVQFETESSRDLKKEISKQVKTMKERFTQLEKEKEFAKELIEEFKWMKNVKTLEDMKEKIKTCEFWAESWTINILERALNIKLIVLSQQNYDAGDLDNVIQCGDMVDPDIEAKGVFKPDNYIITSYRGDHYILIRYNGERIFTFDTLPLSIKNLVMTKCLERNGGIYSYIPEFISMKTVVEEKQSVEVLGDSKPKTDLGAEDVDLSKMERFDEGYDIKDDVVFDNDIVFQFYSKSQNAKPGKGSGEKIPKERILDFSELASIPNWRRTLSNFYLLDEPFVLDGKRWRSVEHYYHASKFKRDNLDFYAQFSVDSASKISEDPAMAKAAGGKTGKYKGVQVRPKDIKMDPDFFTSKRNELEMYRGQMAKYKTDEEARKVLLATNDAKLQHYIRGGEPIVFYDTMKIREILAQKE
jgi:predicted NAD-dependent protein-ADP-ribosyltransferase YbiA (DUF1768 family)